MGEFVSALDELVTRLGTVLRTSVETRRYLLHAANLIEQAEQLLAEALHGSVDPNAGHARAALTHARHTVAEISDLIGRTENRIQSYLHSIAAEFTDATSESATTRTEEVRATPTTERAAEQTSPAQERIDQLRQELPPAVQRGTGQKTHGRWIAPDGSTHSMISGRDDLTYQVNSALDNMGCPTLPIIASSDVELKLAALMLEKGSTDPKMRHITLVINNRPCKGRLGCETLLPVLLLEGYSLTVHGPDYRKRFTGGAKPWWR